MNPATQAPPRANINTTRLLVGLLDAAMVRTSPATAPEIVAGRIVVRLIDAGLSLRAVEEATGLHHPQRKLDGQRALTVADLDAFATALAIDVAELLEPALSDVDHEVLRLIEAATRYDADGEVLAGADVWSVALQDRRDRVMRLAAQGLVAVCHRGGYNLTAAGARWSRAGDETRP